MSDSTPPLSSKELNAEAKASKAKAKALRPWYQKKRAIVPGAILALIVISSVTGGNNDSTNNNTSNNSSNGGNEEVQESEFDAQMGENASDGQFTFVVKDFKCGIQSVGSDVLGAEAKGQYCRIELEVLNTGDEAQYFFDSNQYLFDSSGREYSSASDANLWAGDSEWMDEINPGLGLSGAVYFDVPESFEVSHIELHDSAFSGGVSVEIK
jgi:hypothetical protein